MKLNLIRKFFLIFFGFNIILTFFLFVLNFTEIKKYVDNNCKIFVEINISDDPPILFYEYNSDSMKKKILAIFFNQIKNKYNIINSDNGVIIDKYGEECNKILKNIEKDIQNVQLANIIIDSLNRNLNLYNSNEFKKFKKTFKLNLEGFEFLAVLLKTDLDYKLIEIKKIQEYKSFSNMNFKVVPSLLIVIFGNLFFYIFYFYRERIKKII